MEVAMSREVDTAAVTTTDGRPVHFPIHAVYMRKIQPHEIEDSDYDGDLYGIFFQSGQPKSIYADTETALEESADEGLIVLTLQ